ncbi:hypothetical protein GCM10023194_25690 [Planotetraspora phitsanulokensis]|uniref:Uncharacterized protein n=1 Tax=Planotetraspora phitsanulokensis TaxID=575192 RepID=A0A8J3XJE1_9ACTN|nr:hypothetical protein [Planotetraspora phitsanulokensis]GII41916.1 hypothetical protein Pph01_69190 [Planotetraspora phitsanulokensis]
MSGATEVSLETLYDERLRLMDGVLSTWSWATLRGIEVMLNYEAHPGEVERRRQVGLGAITSADALRFLLGLPVGTPVPLAALDQNERHLLRMLPTGTVCVENGFVTRLAVPPVDAGLVVVPTRSWRLGLERAGRFAPFCARAMMLPKPPPNLDVLRMEADFYGIGVITYVDAAPVTVVPPEPFRRHRFTAAGWLFLEEAHRQLL